MQPRQALDPRLSARPFLVADALRLGHSRRRLEGRDLVASFHGVRSTVSPDTPTALARAYLPRLREGQAFSHTTAAHVAGLPLPGRYREERVIHVATGPGQHVRAAGVVGHRVMDGVPLVRHDGLPVTTAIRTLVDLAALLNERELVVAGDALMGYVVFGEGNRLVGPDEMRAALAALAGRRGARCLFRALERMRAGVESPMETLLRLLLVDAGLPEPLVNRRYWAADGTYLGKPDLSYPRWRIAIEYEGDQHREDPRQFNIDLRRYGRFESEGWSVIRVAKDGVLRFPQETVDTVRKRIESRSGLAFA